jgi:methylmalonyl-CoA/ethylmalonyl-CoA epimerase
MHAMELKFRHVDVLVKNLDEACAYYAQILKARISKTLVWERGGLHVHYAIALIGQERFMLVQPLAGSLKELLDSSGEGMIYRHCYSTPDIEKAYEESRSLKTRH